jgi:hypothetical protein
LVLAQSELGLSLKGFSAWPDLADLTHTALMKIGTLLTAVQAKDASPKQRWLEAEV